MSSNTNYPKVCVQCGTHFTAKKLSTQFCSHRCSSLAYKQKKREQKITIAKVDVKNHSLPPIKHQKNSNQIKPSANNLSTLNEREYLSVVETATLMGVCKLESLSLSAHPVKAKSTRYHAVTSSR